MDAGALVVIGTSLADNTRRLSFFFMLYIFKGYFAYIFWKIAKHWLVG